MKETEKTIKLNGKEYKIQKMGLKKYAQMVKALKHFPEIIKDVASIDIDEEKGESKEDYNKKALNAFLPKIPDLVDKSFPELIKVIHVATDIKEKDLEENIGLDDLSEILVVVFELNDFSVVKKNLSKIMQSIGVQNNLKASIQNNG